MEKTMGRLDYSPHQLQAQKYMREIHDLLLERDFVEAAGKVEFVIAELRLMKAAIHDNIR
jgi:hypothetical protein